VTPELRERHTLAWLRSAAVDLRVSHALAEQHIGAPWAACFHAQQAVAKTLKASMVWAGVPVQDTHDLRTLARGLPANWPGSTWDAQAAELTLYAVETRYPMAEQTPTWEDAQQAVVLADRLTRSVLAGLRKRGLPEPPRRVHGSDDTTRDRDT
jgi:HEPN domain-containing protein